MKTVKELQYEARSILDLAKNEDRELTADEAKKFDVLVIVVAHPTKMYKLMVVRCERLSQLE